MYVTVVEKIGMEKGMEIGLEKGKEIGKKIGKEIGKEIGKGEGILLGEERMRREAVFRMLDRGLDPALIAECVDLPEEEVRRLRDERG